MAETLTTRKRIQSIDLLRGTVMVLMALDHVRDYFHYDAFFFDPTDLTQTYPALFWTRFITHYCAPVFVLLAGTSAFMVGQKKDKTSLSIWLLKRGFWLIFVELTIVKFAWFFQLDYASLIVMVIWALGISMIVLAGFIHLPKKLGITQYIAGVSDKEDEEVYFEIEYMNQPDDVAYFMDIHHIGVDEYLDYINLNQYLKL